MNRRSILLWTATLSVLLSTVMTTVIVVVAKQQLPGQLKQPLTGADHCLASDGNARAVLVVYSDFQCQACAHAALDFKRLQESSAGKLALVHRHFPLPSHGQAMLAARAAEAAGKQGKYAEMHDLLFQRQGQWIEKSDARDRFLAYAAELGLDPERFAFALDNDAAITAKIDADQRGALVSGAKGTPTLFLNGQLLPGRFDAVKGTIDEIIAR
ncbi:MAG: DsbA family protein [Candidatus Obscuribacterales bacterium]|nr:DsbA family protein [Candidatus Obscuribacterales bacterium]